MRNEILELEKHAVWNAHRERNNEMNWYWLLLCCVGVNESSLPGSV